MELDGLLSTIMHLSDVTLTFYFWPENLITISPWPRTYVT